MVLSPTPLLMALDSGVKSDRDVNNGGGEPLWPGTDVNYVAFISTTIKSAF